MTEINLHNEDFRVMLKRLKNKSVDLAYLDPPYGIGWKDNMTKYDYPNKDGITGDDDLHEFNVCLQQMRFKLKRDAHIYIFAGHQKIDEVLHRVKQLYHYDCMIVWRKLGFKPSGNTASYVVNYEFIVVAKVNQENQRNMTKRREAFIETPYEPVATRIHAHQKPLKVVDFIFKNSFVRGGLIIDPFAGSARAGIVARNYSMDYEGSEIDKDTYDKAYDNLYGTKRWF